MVRIAGGNGESIDEAIIILDAKTLEDTFIPRIYIMKKFGNDAKVERTPINRGTRYYDKMDVKLPDGTMKTLYFDITSFGYGNKPEKKPKKRFWGFWK
jgi:hypothetical protein